MDGQFFTWEALSAMGGASLLTFFVVQYTKTTVDRWLRLPTDLYALFIAYMVLLASQLAVGSPAEDWRLYVLTLANSFLVAATAGQLQNKSLHPPTLKEKEEWYL